MKFLEFLKDRLYSIFLGCFSYFIIFLILVAFKVDRSVVVSVTFILLFTYFLNLLIDYFRKRKFYNELFSNISNLDKSYLVLETIHKPGFYEGDLLCQALYEINKSMGENVKGYEIQLNDFKEYIEMWIHEVKMPLSTLVLFSKNYKIDKKMKIQLKRLEDYVDQVLYYVRCENAEKDYLIKEVNLSKVIKNVGLRNMDDLLENKVDFIVDDVDFNVLTDSKWLEFILNQIINNSIKYRKDKSFIRISAEDFSDRVVLNIYDNGIGIKKSDIGKVFDKCFTGYNGRIRNQSTGIGLFIAKNLCRRLGHKLEISSCFSEYTNVSITFSKNKYYDVVR